MLWPCRQYCQNDAVNGFLICGEKEKEGLTHYAVKGHDASAFTIWDQMAIDQMLAAGRGLVRPLCLVPLVSTRARLQAATDSASFFVWRRDVGGGFR